MVASVEGSTPGQEETKSSRSAALNKLSKLDYDNWTVFTVQSAAVFEEIGVEDAVFEPYPTEEDAVNQLLVTMYLEPGARPSQVDINAQLGGHQKRYKRDNKVAWRLLVKALDLNMGEYGRAFPL